MFHSLKNPAKHPAKLVDKKYLLFDNFSNEGGEYVDKNCH